MSGAAHGVDKAGGGDGNRMSRRRFGGLAASAGALAAARLSADAATAGAVGSDVGAEERPFVASRR
jgi:hypothetical protein